MDLLSLDATEMARLIISKKVSPVEIIEACLNQIEKFNPSINAIVTLADRSIDRARKAEQAIMRGEKWGPMHGVPFTIKDCIDTSGTRTTIGSLIYQNNVPPIDATVVKRLSNSGGILIGKTNLPEFALWWETGNRIFGQTNNPWDLKRTPGGSSGGEAAAIASRMSPIGVGSDVGGSIREPANYCGIVGLKATHGRIPLTGHWPDVLLRYMHVGPLSRTVRDASLALSILSGSDGIDAYSLPLDPPIINLDPSINGLKIALCTEGYFDPVDPEVKQKVLNAAKIFEEMGCHIETHSLDSWHNLSAQSISDSLFTAEGQYWLKEVVQGKEKLLAPNIKSRLSKKPPSMEEYQQAISDSDSLKQDVAKLFYKYDLLICPTVPGPAHLHNSNTLEIDGQKVPARNALRATVPFDITGSPSVSVPFGMSSNGLPIGVQIIGRHLDEETVLRAAAKLEASNQGGYHVPPGF